MQGINLPIETGDFVYLNIEGLPEGAVLVAIESNETITLDYE